MVDEPISLFRAGQVPAARKVNKGITETERDLDAGRDDARDPDVFFDRRELQTILNLYGRMVAQAEWRDYAIATARDYVCFAVYRRTAEFPLYRIEKRPKLRAKQGMYAVVSVTGMILRRGHDLAQVLKVLEPKRLG